MGGSSFSHYTNSFQILQSSAQAAKPFAFQQSELSAVDFCIVFTLGIRDLYDFQMTVVLYHTNQLGASCAVRKALVWEKKCRRKLLWQKILRLISKRSSWNQGCKYPCSLPLPGCSFPAQVVHLALLSNMLVSHTLHPSAEEKRAKKDASGAKWCWQVRSINFFLSSIPFLSCSMSFTLH